MTDSFSWKKATGNILILLLNLSSSESLLSVYFEANISDSLFDKLCAITTRGKVHIEISCHQLTSNKVNIS